MDTLGAKLRDIRKKNGLTLDELAELLNYKYELNINKSMISRWENNKATPMNTFISAYAKEFNIDLNYLLGLDSSDSINIYRFENVFPVKTKRIPLLGEIACGKPIFASEDRESYIEVGTDIKADFCLKAKGDSMIGARINDGDIVFIRRQSSVDDGEIAAVLIDDEVTLKRVYYHKDKNIIELRAENPKFQAMIFMDNELDQIVILGKAIAFQSDVI